MKHFQFVPASYVHLQRGVNVGRNWGFTNSPIIDYIPSPFAFVVNGKIIGFISNYGTKKGEEFLSLFKGENRNTFYISEKNVASYCVNINGTTISVKRNEK